MAELPLDEEGQLLSLEGLVNYVSWELTRAYRGLAEYDDIVQDAWVGAVSAVRKYDASTGLALSTFAYWKIRGAAIDGLRQRDHLSRTYRAKLRAAGKTVRNVSLSTEISLRPGDAPVTLGDMIECPDAQAAFDRLEDVDAVSRAVAKLPDRLRYVVVEYYWTGRSLVDIALELRVSESRVSQILCKAREWLYVSLRDTYVEFPETDPEPALRALA